MYRRSIQQKIVIDVLDKIIIPNFISKTVISPKNDTVIGYIMNYFYMYIIEYCITLLINSHSYLPRLL